MKKSLYGVALGALCGLSMLGAASTAHAERGTVGFGATVDLNLGSVSPLLAVPTGLGNVLVPIQVGESLMIEPEFGLFRTSTDDNTLQNLRLGVGVFFKDAITKDVNIYGGVRLGVSMLSSDSESRESSQNSLWVGGVSGGEYFINNAFSVGGEWGLYVIAVGDSETTSTLDGEEFTDGPGEGVTLISTSTRIVVRWYFL